LVGARGIEPLAPRRGGISAFAGRATAGRDLAEAGLLTGARYGELRELPAGDYDRRRLAANKLPGAASPPFIASALTGGVDIHTVAKITGTSVRMIEERYGKLLHDDARERLNQIVLA
jgi:hypothetical protein